MFKDPFKWLIHKGLIFATLLINTLSASITVLVIMIILLVDNWLHKNWP